HLVGHRREQRNDDERELEEVEEEREQEDEHVDEDQEPGHAARNSGEQVLHPQVAVHRAEGEAEDRRANQDEDDERGELGGRVHRLPEQRPGQAPVDERQHERPRRPHGTPFGRRRDAEEDGAEDEEDERERRDHDEEHAPEQLPAAQRPRLRRQGRGGLRKEQRAAHDIKEVHAGQDERGIDGAGVHVAHRAAELVGQHDEHEARRDDLRERAGGRDDASGELAVVAVAHHDGQGDEPHRDHRGGHHAGGGGEQRADEDDRVGEAAAHRPEELPHGVEQVLGHAASLQDEPHEGEERHREQRVVRHDAEDALGQRLEEHGAQQPELEADEAEEDAERREREGDRVAEEQEEHQRHEH